MTRKEDHPPSPAPHDDAPIIHPPLLDFLLTRDTPVGIDLLAGSLDLPVDRVRQELARLEAVGCQLDRHPQHGVRLASSGLGAWADYLRWAHPSPPNAQRQRLIEVYQQTTSTQDLAKRAVGAYEAGADRAILIAGYQTAGRGRMGRRWFAPAGCGVTFSMVRCLRACDAMQVVNRLTLACAVAVARALDPLIAPATIEIKWPNDLLVGGRKLAGILVETSLLTGTLGHWAAIIGVGINVTLSADQIPEESLRPRVTSLATIGCPADPLIVLSRGVRELDHTLSEKDPGNVLDSWRRRCPPRTVPGRFQTDGRVIQGQVIDVDPTQGLIVRTSEGVIVHLPAATTTVLDEPS